MRGTWELFSVQTWWHLMTFSMNWGNKKNQMRISSIKEAKSGKLTIVNKGWKHTLDNNIHKEQILKGTWDWYGVFWNIFSLFKCCCLKTQILSMGMDCLKEGFAESVTLMPLVKCLTETWTRFYRCILPSLDEIFFRVKVDVLTNWTHIVFSLGITQKRNIDCPHIEQSSW